ncbi:hypothetical protein EGJ55_16045 [Pseudomonas moraviensis]|nr:hypothetical protein EGJ55_16045 [Pseudomonas moraviensis]
MSDAFVAGLLSDTEVDTFKAWAVYKLQLSKVDTGLKTPKWPSVPES